MLPNHLAISASAAALSLSAGSVLGQATAPLPAQLLVQTGAAEPGGGPRVLLDFTRPLIDNNGNVYFVSTAREPNGGFDSGRPGLYSSPSPGLTSAILAPGQAAPQLPAGVTVRGVADFGIAPTMWTYATVDLEGTGVTTANSSALLVRSPQGGFRLLWRQGNPLPGFPTAPLTTADTVNLTSSSRINRGGLLVTTFLGSSALGAPQRGLFRFDTLGNPQPIAVTNQSAPGASGDLLQPPQPTQQDIAGRYRTIATPTINSAGDVTFPATTGAPIALTGATWVAKHGLTGVWRSGSSLLGLLLSDNTPFNGQARLIQVGANPDFGFPTFLAPYRSQPIATNDSGFALIGAVPVDANGSADLGLYLTAPSQAPIAIGTSGGPIGGTDARLFFAYPFQSNYFGVAGPAPVINNAGQMAFVAYAGSQISGKGALIGRQGLSGENRLIALVGQPAVGVANDWIYVGFDGLQINPSGDVLFSATIGSSLFSPSGRGLFLAKFNGDGTYLVQKVVATGDILTGSSSPVFTVEPPATFGQFGSEPAGGHDGGSMAINDAGVITYVVDRTRVYRTLPGNAACLQPVTINASPSDATACTNSPVVFSVGHGGNAPFNYRWEFRGGPATDWVPVGNSDATSVDGTVLLTAAGAGTTDVALTFNAQAFPAGGTGQLRCTVINACGGSTSAVATITIQPCGSCSIADLFPPGGDGVVDGGDFVAFINSFAIGDPLIDPVADIAGDGPSGLEPDGVIDGTDFVAFINAFAIGC